MTITMTPPTPGDRDNTDDAGRAALTTTTTGAVNPSTADPQVTAMVAVVLIAVGAVLVARAGLRRARTLTGTGWVAVGRPGALILRTVVTTLVILTVQWAVLTHTTDPRAVAAVLGVPALVAGAAVARAITSRYVTAGHNGHRRGGGHR